MNPEGQKIGIWYSSVWFAAVKVENGTKTIEVDASHISGRTIVENKCQIQPFQGSTLKWNNQSDD